MIIGFSGSISMNNIRDLKEKLAVEAGVSYNTIIKIERGEIKNPRIETVIKLAEVLEVSIDDLVGRKNKSILE